MYALWQLERANAGPSPDVCVHVYDIGGGLVSWVNTLMAPFGSTGAYHVGVEVYGEEWSFGRSRSSQCEKKTGIQRTEPKAHPIHEYRETIHFGQTQMTAVEVQVKLNEMRGIYLQSEYHFIRRNCITFAQDFVYALTGRDLPPRLFELMSTLDSTANWFSSGTDEPKDVRGSPIATPRHVLSASWVSFGAARAPEDEQTDATATPRQEVSKASEPVAGPRAPRALAPPNSDFSSKDGPRHLSVQPFVPKYKI
mmetsp:Transcript_89792/g.253235  ORF Transcript_89792/g.253235 Transcript_89792/m.253235 type:complete len:253 (-) Transcript_89792:131-889(-)